MNVVDQGEGEGHESAVVGPIENLKIVLESSGNAECVLVFNS